MQVHGGDLFTLSYWGDSGLRIWFAGAIRSLEPLLEVLLPELCNVLGFRGKLVRGRRSSNR